MQRMTGGQAVVAALKAEGVEHVFGIAGTHNTPLFDGAYGEPAIHVVTVRHEQGAAMMAAGYARASGRIAACFVVPGPGLTNALSGMGMAYSESTPLLMFAGQNALAQLGREADHFHELPNSLAVAGSVCGYAERVSAPGAIPRAVREAMRAMRCRRPRPAYIEVPLDVQSGEAEVELLPREAFSRPAGDPAGIARAAAALKSAKRPFIFAGGGVASAEGSRPLVRLAELLGAPVVTSMFARGVISDRHPLALGDGWGRFNLYDELLAQADMALVVGSRIDIVSDANLGARFPKRIVQVDLDPLVVGLRQPVEVGIVGDAATVLDALAEALAGGKSRECWFDLAGFRQRRRAWMTERAGPVLQVIEDLRAALPEDTIFVDDLTLVGYWMPLLPRDLHAAHADPSRHLRHAGVRAAGRNRRQARLPEAAGGGDLGRRRVPVHAAGIGDRSGAEAGPDRAGVQRQRLRCDQDLSGPGVPRTAHRLRSGESGFRQTRRGLRRA